MAKIAKWLHEMIKEFKQQTLKFARETGNRQCKAYCAIAFDVIILLYNYGKVK